MTEWKPLETGRFHSFTRLRFPDAGGPEATRLSPLSASEDRA